MISKLKALQNSNEDGFTLIELLIVVVIIGILAAIAIPIFLNQQKAAVDATVKSDVRNTVSNVATELVKNPTSDDLSTATVVKTGDDNVITVVGGWDSYTVAGYNANGGEFSSAATAYTFDSTTGNYSN